MSNTVLAFDFGTKKIGVAVGNSQVGTCSPLGIIEAKNKQVNWDGVENIIKKWRPGTIVVGLPLDMYDGFTEITKLTEAFITELQNRVAIPVKSIDEKLSTKEAENRIKEFNIKDSDKNKLDAIAAMIILEAWFETNK